MKYYKCPNCGETQSTIREEETICNSFLSTPENDTLDRDYLNDEQLEYNARCPDCDAILASTPEDAFKLFNN